MSRNKVFWFRCQAEPDYEVHEEGELFTSLVEALAHAEAAATRHGLAVDLYLGERQLTFNLAWNASALFFLLHDTVGSFLDDGVPASELVWSEDIPIGELLFEAADFDGVQSGDDWDEADQWSVDAGFLAALEGWYHTFAASLTPVHARYFGRKFYRIGPEERVNMESWRKALTDQAVEIERKFNLRCDIVRNDVHIDTVGGVK